MTERPDEQVFDSLLEEMLTGQRPPDLTDIISERARREFGTLRRSVSAATSTNAPDASSSTVRVAHSSERLKRTSTSRSPSLAVLLATVARVITVAVLASSFVKSLLQDGNQVANNQKQPPTDTKAGPDIAKNAPSHKQPNSQNASANDPVNVPGSGSEGSLVNSERDARPAGQDLPLNSVPFGHRPYELNSPTLTESVVASVKVDPWSDDRIIEFVNDKFDALWMSNNVSKPQLVSPPQLMERVSNVLVGQTGPVNESTARELSTRLLSTGAFAEAWADKVVSYWMRGTPAENRSDAGGAALRMNIAQQIVARRPWNEILAGLINSDSDSPSSAFLATLSGGDNHRLVSRISSSLLDESLACARCHDASENGRVISMDQDDYWSLVGIFSGIDGKTIKHEDGRVERVLVDRQKDLFKGNEAPTLFFNRPDGRLQAARFRLPGGDHWRTLKDAETPRESLAKWIATTSVTDKAAVNLAWRMVFGRPLVADHLALEDQGQSERRQILETLAAQYQAHDRNMTTLVQWIVSTKPFAVQSLAVDRQRWLKASDDEIKSWNSAVNNFASYVGRRGTVESPKNLEAAVASTMRWSSSGDTERAIVAQPLTTNNKNANTNIKRPVPGTTNKNDSQPQITYLIRTVSTSPAQLEFVGRLTASKLKWHQQVDHIAGLIGEPAGNAKLHKLADQILEAKNDDQAAALMQLLQSALLCNET